MNIFVLDSDPKIAASYHCDKHVIKMIVETAQMLCTNQHYDEDGTRVKKFDRMLYKPSFVNHPCTVWARESEENYQWLCELGLALCDEYEARYGKIHKTKKLIQWCTDNPPALPNDVGLTKFPSAMPDYCKISDDPVENYKEFYRVEKSKFAKWNYSKVPSWYTDMSLLSEHQQVKKEINNIYGLQN